LHQTLHGQHCLHQSLELDLLYMDCSVVLNSVICSVGTLCYNVLTIYLHYLQVMRSITDNITEEKLLEEIDEIRRLPMYADRIKQAQATMTQQAKIAAHHRRKYNASI
jgi:hypothetical protein